mmetsp:Transcript_14544/g.31047  ORF Transcript_14544/g.31047 Transcript_14544/m.31047 type:complete len:195 (+) Transcript_14544:201-785(+)
MRFDCAAKHLCGAPPGMPVLPNLNHPDKPQYSCAICTESMHSAVFCGYKLGEVKAQLAKYSIKDSSAVLVCKLCYVNHSRDAAQGLITNTTAAVTCDDGRGEDQWVDMPLLGRRNSTAVAADSKSGVAEAASKANAVAVGGGAAAVIALPKTKKKKKSLISAKKRAPPATASKTTAKKGGRRGKTLHFRRRSLF